jgi:hypothetical protein
MKTVRHDHCTDEELGREALGKILWIDKDASIGAEHDRQTHIHYPSQ